MNQQVEQGQSAPETDRSGKGSLVQTQIGRVVSDKLDKTVTVLHRRGGAWGAATPISTPPGAYHVAAADFDRKDRSPFSKAHACPGADMIGRVRAERFPMG